MDKDSSVPVDGPKLWADREALSATQEDFLDLMGDSAVSLSTLQRAESSRSIQLGKLTAIAKTIGQPAEKYIRAQPSIDRRTTCEVNGAWEGFYLEPDVSLSPTLIAVRMIIAQKNTQVSIEVYEVGSDGEERNENVIDATIVGDMLKITSVIDGWKQPTGITTVMLKVSHGDEYMAGFAIWYDKDTNHIESSKIAFARVGTHSFSDFLEKAKSVALEETST
jgi:transcriptional regulator with XRE-family HTH domain